MSCGCGTVVSLVRCRVIGVVVAGHIVVVLGGVVVVVGVLCGVVRGASLAFPLWGVVVCVNLCSWRG